MSDIEDDEIIEESAVISEVKISLINELFHKSHSEYRLI